MAVDDSYTKLLLHMDGADNGTTFIDESGKSITRIGNVCTKTETKKFGTTSGFFNGDGLSLADSDDWYLGTGDFTVDFWFNFITLPVNNSVDRFQMFYSQRAWDTNRHAFAAYHDGTRVVLQLLVNSTKYFNAYPATPFVINQWYHVAVVRNGNNWMLFLDGTQIGATVVDARAIGNITSTLDIGRYMAGYYYVKGYIDEFRWSKGIARWTENFTPPTSAYAPEESDPTSLEGVIVAQSTVTGALNKVTNLGGSVVATSVVTGNIVNVYRVSPYMPAVATLGIITGRIRTVVINLSAVSNLAAESHSTTLIAISLSATAGLSIEACRNVYLKGAVLAESNCEADFIKIVVASEDLVGLGFLHIQASRVLTCKPSLSGRGTLKCEADYTFNQAIMANTRNISAKLEIYFDGLDQDPVTLTKEQVMTVKLLEELQADNGKPLGAISSNVLDAVILNSKGIFTPTNKTGLYHGKLVPQVPVKAYVVAWVKADQYTEIALGTFYSDDWKSPNSKLETSITCYDRLYALAQKAMPTVKTQRNTSIKKLFVLVFELLGLTSADYHIDPAIDIPLDYGWLPQGTVGKALQWLAEAGLCIVYVDRYNIIQVKQLDFIQRAQYTLTGEAQLTDNDIPTSYTSVYSKLNMNYYIPTLGAPESLVNISGTTIPAGVTTLKAVAFSKGPVALIDYAALIGTKHASIKVIQNTSWDVDLEITNAGDEEKCTVAVFGRIVNTTCIPIVQEDLALKAIIGEKAYSVENPLIQDVAYATQYGTILFRLVTNPNSRVKIDTRGNPQIELGNVVAVRDSSSPVADVTALAMRLSLTLDGGLEETLEGVVIDEL